MILTTNKSLFNVWRLTACKKNGYQISSQALFSQTCSNPNSQIVALSLTHIDIFIIFHLLIFKIHKYIYKEYKTKSTLIDLTERNANHIIPS